MKNKPVIGVDLEGKRIRVGRVEDGKIEAHTSSYISHDKDEQTVLNEVFDAIEQVFNEEVIGIGVGVPSLVDIEAGIVHHVHSIPSWKKIPLKSILEEKFGVQVFINNDANCFVTGEKYFGKGQNYKNLVGLIVGSGLGAGIVIDDKLTAGVNCGAGEFGKIPYLDHDFEYYCSEQFFINEYEQTCDQLLEKALMNDAHTLEIFSKFGSHLGNVIVTVMNTIDPELVVLGGAISKGYKYFKNSMYKSMAKFEYKDAVISLQVDVSEEPKIAILGAAAIYYDAQKSHSLNELSQKVQLTEEALKESEKKYHDLFNHILDPVFIYDRKTHKFLDCNESVVEKMYGYSFEELKKMTPYDLHPPDEHKKVQKSINIKNPDFPFSYTHMTKSGKRFEVEILSDEINYEGIDCWISIVRDITDRRRIEKKAKRQAAQASIVYEVGKSLSSQLELELLFSQIVQTIYQTFDFYGVMLMLISPKDKKLKLTSIAGGYEDVFPSTLSIKFGEGMIGLAAQERKTQVSANVRKNKNYIMKAEEVTLSEVSVPLMSGENVIGVLDIQSNRLNAFDESDVTSLETLSTQIAAAIENARLYNQAQDEINNRIKAQKELLTSKESLEVAKKETDDILNNVEEGIFLMDSSLTLGSQYSHSLEKILGINKIAKINLINILQGRASDEIIESVKEYFDLYFNSSVDQKMLEELNPLSEIEIGLSADNESKAGSRFLSFNFKRIRKEKGAKSDTNLIASVMDITEQKVLAKKLKESEEKTKKQLETLLNILHVEASLLREFMESTDQEIKHVNALLKQTGEDTKLLALLEDMYRSVHLIKGNAGLLDLKLFVDMTHSCEDLIDEAKKNKAITAKDFTPISIKIAELTIGFRDINELIEKISTFQTNFRPKRSYENKLMINSIGNLINNLAKEMGKKVVFKHEKFDTETIPFEHRLLIKEVLVQLARNSIFHGIESAQERKSANKKVKGKIEISSQIKGENYSLIFEDDGRGIQIDKLKEKAIKADNKRYKNIDSWSEKKVANLIFIQGISTAESVDTTAGRGVGMDIIKNNIDKHGGSILFDFEQGAYCRFTIKLPANRRQKN